MKEPTANFAAGSFFILVAITPFALKMEEQKRAANIRYSALIYFILVYQANYKTYSLACRVGHHLLKTYQLLDGLLCVFVLP